MTKKQKKSLRDIIIATSLFFIIFITDFLLAKLSKNYPLGLGGLLKNKKIGFLLPLILYFCLYVFIAKGILKKCFNNIIHGRLLDENFLMTLASLSAFALGIYNGISGSKAEGFDEAVAVNIFYQIGELFNSLAVGKSRKAISKLIDIMPDKANLLIDNKVEIKSPNCVKVGDVIVINPGEKIPLDGVIIKGESSVDTKALTGEAEPQYKKESDSVISGCINLSGKIFVKVTKAFYDSTVKKILELVESSQHKKSKTENFISKFAVVYTPIVVFSGLLLALIPTLITGNAYVWIYRALSFLVVSCPCALVISVPLAFFAGIGTLSKHGVLVKGSNFIELLSKSNYFVFDKTGTLTKGTFEIIEIYPKENSEKILTFARIAEANLNHPIAKSITGNTPSNIQDGYSIKNFSGKGVLAKNDKEEICVGNAVFMAENGIKIEETLKCGTAVHVAENGTYLGYILLSDDIKDDAYLFSQYINKIGAKSLILSGDKISVVKSVAKNLGIPQYKGELLPDRKVNELEKILANKSNGDCVLFVGDGINDAPSLMRADIGVSMGQIGSDAAIEASDVVLTKDNLEGLIFARQFSKKIMRTVYQNIVFSLFIKLGILILSAFGLANMWLAIFGDVGVAMLAILNSMKLLKKNNKSR